MKTHGDTAVMIVCGLAMLAMVAAAQAESLSDPTRPPAAIEGPVVPAAGTGQAVPEAGLQSTILRQGSRPAAMINGEYVELGGRVGEARVVRILEDAVILKTNEGMETLKLMPGVERTQVYPPAAKNAVKGGKAVQK